MLFLLARGRSPGNGYHVMSCSCQGGTWNVVRGTRSVHFTESNSKWCHKIWKGDCGPLGTDMITLHEFGHGSGYRHLLNSGSQMWADLVSEYLYRKKGMVGPPMGQCWWDGRWETFDEFSYALLYRSQNQLFQLS